MVLCRRATDVAVAVDADVDVAGSGMGDDARGGSEAELEGEEGREVMMTANSCRSSTNNHRSRGTNLREMRDQ